MTQKNRKRTEFSSFEVLDVLFCGLKASHVAWTSCLIKKERKKNSAVFFFVIRTLDPYPDPHGSALI